MTEPMTLSQIAQDAIIIIKKNDGTTLQGLAENLRAAQNSFDHGEIIPTTHMHLQENKELVCVVQGECKIVMECGESQHGDTNNDLSMSGHHYNDDFHMRMDEMTPMFDNPIEVFHILTTKIAKAAKKQCEGIMAEGRSYIRPEQLAYQQIWDNIIQIVACEHQKISEKDNQTKSDAFILVNAAGLGNKADFTIKHRDKNYIPTPMVMEKWIKPLKPALYIELPERDHSIINVKTFVPHFGLAKFLLEKGFNSVDMLKAYSSLPEIRGPIVCERDKSS